MAVGVGVAEGLLSDGMERWARKGCALFLTLASENGQVFLRRTGAWRWAVCTAFVFTILSLVAEKGPLGHVWYPSPGPICKLWTPKMGAEFKSLASDKHLGPLQEVLGPPGDLCWVFLYEQCHESVQPDHNQTHPAGCVWVEGSSR